MEEGDIRAVNYVDSTDPDGTIVIRFRIEQFRFGHWKSIPVYQEQPNGSLVEIPQ